MQNIATVNPDGSGVVTIDEQEPVHITTGSVEETRRALLSRIIDHAHQTGRSVDVLACDPQAEHRLRVHPDGNVQPIPTAELARTSPTHLSRTSSKAHVVGGRPRWIIPVVVSIGLILATCVALMILIGHGEDTGSQPVMATQDVSFAASPPAEWSREAKWRSPALADDGGRALVMGVNGDRVGLVLKDPRKVVMVKAATGETLWSGDIPEAKLADGLHATYIDGQLAVATQAGSQMLWWNFSDGSPGSIDLPANATASFYGDQPLIGTSSTTAALITRGKLIDVAVPNGATAYAARADGVITAASRSGWWHLKAGQAPGKVTAFEYPSTTPVQPLPVAYTGGALVTYLAPTATGQLPRVVIYSDRPDDVRLLFQSPITLPDGGSMTWRPSTSQTWGILGRTLIDLKQASAADLGPWTTKHVTSDRALGQIGSQQVLVGPKISRGVLQGGEGFPDDLTGAGALVRAESDGETYDYLLLPKAKR